MTGKSCGRGSLMWKIIFIALFIIRTCIVTHFHITVSIFDDVQAYVVFQLTAMIEWALKTVNIYQSLRRGCS